MEMRTEFDMMGRSESRDGWRAMSAVGEGNRDYLRCCGLEPNRWGVGFFSLGDGQISRDRLRPGLSQGRRIG
jgi:hypothetical protein